MKKIVTAKNPMPKTVRFISTAQRPKSLVNRPNAFSLASNKQEHANKIPFPKDVQSEKAYQ